MRNMFPEIFNKFYVADGKIYRIDLDFKPGAPTWEIEGDDSHVKKRIDSWMEHYFAKKPLSPWELPLDFSGLTPFTEKVLRRIGEVPFGSISTYKEIAHPAVRAAGQICRRNRFPLIIPCHRIIASSGKLGGYLGTDPFRIQIKAMLLDFEKN